MASLRHAHGHPPLRVVSARKANKAQHDAVAGFHRVLQEPQLVADGVRKDRFEDETFPLSNQLLAKLSDDSGRLVSIDLQFPRNFVRVQKTHTGGLEVSVVESSFPGAVRSRQSYEHGPPIQGLFHFFQEIAPVGGRFSFAPTSHRFGVFTATNLRCTNRPGVRLPFASTLTSSPAEWG